MRQTIRYAIRFFGLLIAVVCFSSALMPVTTGVGPYTSALSARVLADMTPVVCPHSKCVQQGGPSTCEFTQNKACLNPSGNCRTVHC